MPTESLGGLLITGAVLSIHSSVIEGCLVLQMGLYLNPRPVVCVSFLGCVAHDPGEKRN
jgi:hypothetical protein